MLQIKSKNSSLHLQLFLMKKVIFFSSIDLDGSWISIHYIFNSAPVIVFSSASDVQKTHVRFINHCVWYSLSCPILLSEYLSLWCLWFYTLINFVSHK